MARKKRRMRKPMRFKTYEEAMSFVKANTWNRKSEYREALREAAKLLIIESESEYDENENQKIESQNRNWMTVKELLLKIGRLDCSQLKRFQ